MVAEVGKKAPNLKVAKWVQGMSTNIDKEKDKIVLVEVFQVNCPGCFIYGIPEAIDVYKKYHGDGVTVLGLATAFEDYDKNTMENLEMLLKTGEVIGETKRALGESGQLNNNKLPYKIPFPIAMDSLKKESGPLTDSKVLDFVEANFPEFRSQPEREKTIFLDRVRDYLKHKLYTAETFEEYRLHGTPSSILIDKKGILRHISFGQSGVMDEMIRALLQE